MWLIEPSCGASNAEARRVLNDISLTQLSTTEGNSYYVGTKMDAFVYDTLNAWYQEDMGTVSLFASLVSLPQAQWKVPGKFMRSGILPCRLALSGSDVFTPKIQDRIYVCMPKLACSAHWDCHADVAGHPC